MPILFLCLASLSSRTLHPRTSWKHLYLNSTPNKSATFQVFPLPPIYDTQIITIALFKTAREPGIVIQLCNFSTLEVNAGGLGVGG